MLVNDQLVKQYSICEKIIVYKNNLAALVSRNGLTCLKFSKLNLTLFATFFTWLLNVRVESYMTPRYLNSLLISSSCPLRKSSRCRLWESDCFHRSVKTLSRFDLSCLCPCRLLVWYRAGSGDGETRRLGVWSPLLQLPAQIWSVCSTVPGSEVKRQHRVCFFF